MLYNLHCTVYAGPVYTMTSLEAVTTGGGSTNTGCYFCSSSVTLRGSPLVSRVLVRTLCLENTKLKNIKVKQENSCEQLEDLTKELVREDR